MKRKLTFFLACLFIFFTACEKCRKWVPERVNFRIEKSRQERIPYDTMPGQKLKFQYIHEVEPGVSDTDTIVFTGKGKKIQWKLKKIISENMCGPDTAFYQTIRYDFYNYKSLPAKFSVVQEMETHGAIKEYLFFDSLIYDLSFPHSNYFINWDSNNTHFPSVFIDKDRGGQLKMV